MTKDVVMMEDHDGAYHAWKARGIKDRTLVHIDAHMDFGRLPDMDPEEILDVGGKEEIERILSRQPVWNPLSKRKEKLVHIGNYIYPAIKDGIVNKFYWVVPDPSWRTWRGRNRIKRNTNWHKDTIVSSLESLKTIEEPVLLDIDVDFMLTPFIWKDQSPGRNPWIFPQELVKQLNDKKIVFDVATISYSVNGGYTPLRFKYLGDELKSLLEGRRDYRQSEASVCFNSCLSHLNSRPPDRSRAKYFYQKAIDADKSYGCEFNNYGIIYQQNGRLKKAEQEYRNFLALDEDNPSVLTGLGYLSLLRRKQEKALDLFEKVLRCAPTDAAALFGKAAGFLSLKKHDEAEALFLKVSQASQDYPESYWWLARIAEKKHQIGSAIQFYKKAVLAGEEGPLVHLLLCRLYLINKNYLRAGEELRRFLHLLWRVQII
jgi:tetratricopeptide (TPR) repeat protein